MGRTAASTLAGLQAPNRIVESLSDSPVSFTFTSFTFILFEVFIMSLLELVLDASLFIFLCTLFATPRQASATEPIDSPLATDDAVCSEQLLDESDDLPSLEEIYADYEARYGDIQQRVAAVARESWGEVATYRPVEVVAGFVVLDTDESIDQAWLDNYYSKPDSMAHPSLPSASDDTLEILPDAEVLDVAQVMFDATTIRELKALAKGCIKGYSNMNKRTLWNALVQAGKIATTNIS